MIPDEFIQELLERVDIVTLIESYIPLRRAGSIYKGLCPFHNEKTASFTVTREKNIFYCFGCQEGGNSIRFIMKYEGLLFPEAIHRLAQKEGLVVPKKELKEGYKYQEGRKVEQLLEDATNYFKAMLKHEEYGKKAREYLIKRGISAKIVEQFDLGYAPKDDRLLYNSAKRRYQDKELELSGLIRRDKKSIFIDKLMFPIRNYYGKVVGFGARSLGDELPKYINTRETDYFKKGALLYGLSKARKEIIRLQQVILVEGYFDVLRLHSEGIVNAVAVLGTALTKSNANYLKKITKSVIIMNDNDSAGEKATQKSAKILIPLGLDVEVVPFEEAKDPDEWVQNNGGEAFKKLLENHKESFLGYYMHMKKNTFPESLGERSRWCDDILEWLSLIPNQVELEFYLEKLSEKISVGKQVLKDRLKKLKQKVSFMESSDKTVELKEKGQEQGSISEGVPWGESKEVSQKKISFFQGKEYIHFESEVIACIVQQEDFYQDLNLALEKCHIELERGVLAYMMKVYQKSSSWHPIGTIQEQIPQQVQQQIWKTWPRVKEISREDFRDYVIGFLGDYIENFITYLMDRVVFADIKEKNKTYEYANKLTQIKFNLRKVLV